MFRITSKIDSTVVWSVVMHFQNSIEVHPNSLSYLTNRQTAKRWWKQYPAKSGRDNYSLCAESFISRGFLPEEAEKADPVDKCSPRKQMMIDSVNVSHPTPRLW